MKEAIATQILLGFLLGHYVVFIDGVSLKSEGGTWGGSLVSRGLDNALDLRAMHHSSFVWIEGVPAMHRATIIPQHEIADLPFVEPYERPIWRSRS